MRQVAFNDVVMATSTAREGVRLFNLAANKLVLQAMHDLTITSMAFHDFGRSLATCSPFHEAPLVLLDVETGAVSQLGGGGGNAGAGDADAPANNGPNPVGRLMFLNVALNGACCVKWRGMFRINKIFFPPSPFQ